MRHTLLAAFVLVPVAAFVLTGPQLAAPTPANAQTLRPPGAQPCNAECDAAWMDANLRLDQMQNVGTAESYKQKPGPALMRLIRMGGKKGAQALEFGLPPLATQLDEGARALSFDVAYDPKGGLFASPAGASMAMVLLPAAYAAAMKRPGFKVIHVLDVDYNSSCLALTDCLKQVAGWSRAHPRHLPIVIALHTNDSRTPMPGATRPRPCDAAALDALESEIRAVFAPGEMITPDQLQGSHASLREAALAHAWPHLGDARGKVIFVLDDSAAKARAYQGTRPSLQGRAMFVAAGDAKGAASPLAAFLSVPDPVKDQARIASAVKDGLMVLTRADAETREARAGATARRDAAFASEAQVVLTDFVTADPAIGAYRVSLADDPAAMCGKALAPEHCVRFAPQPLRTAVAMP